MVAFCYKRRQRKVLPPHPLPPPIPKEGSQTFLCPKKSLLWLNLWSTNKLLGKRHPQDSTLDHLFQHLILGKLQTDHSSHWLSWIICPRKHRSRPCQNPVMITTESVGLPLGTRMLLWEITSFSLTKVGMKMSLRLDHRLLLHLREQDSLPKTPNSTGSGKQIWLDMLARTKHTGASFPM